MGREPHQDDAPHGGKAKRKHPKLAQRRNNDNSTQHCWRHTDSTRTQRQHSAEAQSAQNRSIHITIFILVATHDLIPVLMPMDLSTLTPRIPGPIPMPTPIPTLVPIIVLALSSSCLYNTRIQVLASF